MVGESGQCVFLQTTVSVSFPIQLLLPCNGTGFEQVLWRVVVPSLHVTEHALKCAHTLQIPSTKELSRIDKVKAPYILFYLKSFILMLYWLSINIYIYTKCSCIEIHTRRNSFTRNKNMYYFFYHNVILFRHISNTMPLTVRAGSACQNLYEKRK